MTKKPTKYDSSPASPIHKESTELFGIGLEKLEESVLAKITTTPNDGDVNHHTYSLNHSTAIDILNRAQLSMATFQSIVNLSKSGTEISHRYFPYLNTSVTLFYNSQFSMDRDTNDHDQRLDNILKSWSMAREPIAKDGDCCF